MKDFTTCAGCGRNSHGEEYCTRCEYASEAALREMEKLDRLGHMVEDADSLPPPELVRIEAAISTTTPGRGSKERLP
jgi:hypothetical protein